MTCSWFVRLKVLDLQQEISLPYHWNSVFKQCRRGLINLLLMLAASSWVKRTSPLLWPEHELNALQLPKSIWRVVKPCGWLLVPCIEMNSVKSSVVEQFYQCYTAEAVWWNSSISATLLKQSDESGCSVKNKPPTFIRHVPHTKPKNKLINRHSNI